METVTDLVTFNVADVLGECTEGTLEAFQGLDISDQTAISVVNCSDEGQAGKEDQESGGGKAEEGVREEEQAEPSALLKESSKAGEEDSQEGVECGFLVDRITTLPYQKAVDRGEVPFCAFAPISTPDLYLLRIQNCADATRHMLVPASKEDVFTTPGALKQDESLNYHVAIVAIARQIYSEEDKQLVVSVDALLNKDKKRIQVVKFLSLDKFADFAFLGFDGNVSEFASGKADKEGQGRYNDDTRGLRQDGLSLSTPAFPGDPKSPPKAPGRRGRGGRRRLGRKSPTPSQQLPAGLFPHGGQFFPGNMQQLGGVPMSHIGNNLNQFIKLENADGESAQFLTQGYQLPMGMQQDPSMYGATQFRMPGEMSMLQVPTPVNEVTLNTTEPGAECETQTTNHDLSTIAIDQLFSSEVSSSTSQGFERSGRGGRRGGGPGRKPGRKPMKERNHNDDFSGLPRNPDDLPVHIPKRRGRPPKNRAPVIQIQPNYDYEACNSTFDDSLNLNHDNVENFDKRLKLQME